MDKKEKKVAIKTGNKYRHKTTGIEGVCVMKGVTIVGVDIMTVQYVTSKGVIADHCCLASMFEPVIKAKPAPKARKPRKAKAVK